jgi:hypothetical protein
LAKKEDGDVTNASSVNVAFVGGGGLETKFMEDVGNVFLPEAGGFRMTLKGVNHWKYFMAINVFFEMLLEPFCVGVIDTDEQGKDAGSRGVGEGILGVATNQLVVECSSESTKEMINGLFYTRGKGLGHGV